MRKILTLIFLMAVVVASARSMEFMGLPIEGNVDNFQKKLESKGFKYFDTNDEGDIHMRFLSGTCFDLPCYVNILYDPRTDDVKAVAVVSESVPSDKLDITLLYYETSVLEELKKTPYKFDINNDGNGFNLTVFDEDGTMRGLIVIQTQPTEKDASSVIVMYGNDPQ